MGNSLPAESSSGMLKGQEHLLNGNSFLAKSIPNSILNSDTSVFFEGCAAPTGINATGITMSSAKIVWSSVGTAESYLIRYRKVGDQSWQGAASDSNEVSLSGLNASADYEVQIASRCAGNLGEFSTSINFRTLAATCEAPSAISLFGAGSNYANISWEALPGRNGYAVSYKKVSDIDWKQELVWYDSLGNVLAYLGDLEANTDYVAKVASFCDYRLGEFSSPISFKTAVAATCEAPSGINTTGITTNAARVNWSTVGTAESYVVRYRKVGESAWQQGGAYINGVNLFGLNANTDYEVQVASRCSGNTGAFSASVNFKTEAAATCEAPTGINATGITMNAARVNYASAVNAQYYVIRYRKVGTSNWQQRESYSSNGVNLFDLNVGTDYEVQLASVCNGNMGAFSASVNFKTQAAAACEAPTGLNIIGITMDAARINWSSTATSQYVVARYRKVGTSAWQEKTSYSNGVNVFDLITDTDYEVQVASVCNGIRGAFSASVNFKTNSPAAACAVPSRLRVNTVAMNTALIAWDNVNGATRYTVRYRTVVAGFISNWSSVTAYTNTANLSGLSADKNYEVQVSTICGSSFTDYSASVSFKTLQGGGTGACDAPNGIQASNITTNTASISWAAVSAATGGYVIFYKPTTQSTWKEILSSTNSVALPILASGINYQVKVASVCNSLGKFSEPITFKTLDNSVTSNVQNAVASSTEAIKLYPNPVVDVLNVSNISGNATYKIYNASGTLLSSGNVNDKKINVSQLAQGNYIIMIEQGKDIFRSQFIKR